MHSIGSEWYIKITHSDYERYRGVKVSVIKDLGDNGAIVTPLFRPDLADKIEVSNNHLIKLDARSRTTLSWDDDYCVWRPTE